jgi:hypothetical protein
MVAVDHEVRLTELHGDDRREFPVGKRFSQGAQPVAAEVVAGLEAARERARPALGADDVVERDCS